MNDGRNSELLPEITGSFSVLEKISGKLSSQGTLSATLAISGGALPETYDGPYEVVPKTADQVLDTDHKFLTDDVTVFEIPYAETTNVYGTTVTIAS
jgi:hypothetical protein